MGVFILLFIIVCLIVPEAIIIPLGFLAIAGYGILEFILRLFGKTFDDKPGDGNHLTINGKTYFGKKKKDNE